MYRKWFSLILVGSLSACSSTAYREAPVELVIQIAQFNEAVDSCYKREALTFEEVNTFYNAFIPVISQSNYDQEVYAHAYRESLEHTKSSSPEYIKQVCSKYKVELPRHIANLNSMKAKVKQQNNQPLYTTPSQQVPTYQPPTVAIPSFSNNPQPVQLVDPKPNYNHYLINTPTGTKQCHVSESGYVFCA